MLSRPFRPLLLSLFALPAACATSFADDEATKLHPVAAEVASQLADAEKPFVLLVDFTVPEDKVDAFTKALLKARRSTVKEPGNITYQLNRYAKSPNKFLLFERWKSLAALDAHLKQPYLVELLATFDELLPEGPTITVALPVKGGKKAKRAAAAE